MENKRRSKLAKWSAESLAKLWHIRYALAVGGGYALLFLWLLFSTKVEGDSTVFLSSSNPEWSAPGEDFRFGRNGAGMDLFQLSRTGMANSVVFAMSSVLCGVFVSLIFTALVALGNRRNRFRSLQKFSFNMLLLPAFVAVLIVAAGSGGNILAVMATVAMVVAFSLLGVIGNWCERAEAGGDVMAGLTLGMSRLALLRKRTLPVVTKKCLTLIAALLPTVVAVEMALSFLGFLGNRISCGRIIAMGRENLIEAPWVSIYPGFLASAVLATLTALAWCVARLTKAEMFPRIF